MPLPEIATLSSLKLRQVPNNNSADIFEVFRTFAPFGNSSSSYTPAVVFVAFNMEQYDVVRKKAVTTTIQMALIAFVLGLGALFIIGIAINVRTARGSLQLL